MNFNYILKFFLSFLKTYAGKSYSQCGEDIIVTFLLSRLSCLKPTYLDIGAYHPTAINNTYLFYSRGCSGVCVEADPEQLRIIKLRRHRDLCINAGVVANSTFGKTLPFYIMSPRSLSTFIASEAQQHAASSSAYIERQIEVPVVTINNILASNFTICPDYVSIDIEGLDLEILQSMDFVKYRPKVLCVETALYGEDNTEMNNNKIVTFMNKQRYRLYADTHINSIFVEETAWRNRRS